MLGSPLQNQNLVRQVAAERISRPPGFYKSIALETLGVCAALALGYLYRMFLLGSAPFSHVFTAALVFGMLAAVGMLLQQSLVRRAAVAFAQAAALFAFFYDTPLKTLAVTAGAVYALLLWGELAGYRELAGLMEIRFFRITRAQLKKYTTALVVAGVIFYLPFWTPEKSFIPQSQFQLVWSWVAGMLTQSYPDLTLTSSVRDFAKSMAISELRGDERYRDLSPYAQEKAIATATEEIIQNFEKTLAIQVDAARTLESTLYQYLTASLERWQTKFGAEFLLAWAIAAFLVIRGLGGIFTAAAALLAFVLYQVLIAADAIHVSGESRVKETIQYS